MSHVRPIVVHSPKIPFEKPVATAHGRNDVHAYEVHVPAVRVGWDRDIDVIDRLQKATAFMRG